MAERLLRNDRASDDIAAFDPVAEAAALRLPAHVAQQLWRSAIADAGDGERSDAREAIARFRRRALEVETGHAQAPIEPGKLARTVSPRIEPAAVIARYATGTVGETSDRALELAARSAGRPLPLTLQHRFAYLFQHGFDHVALHIDTAAHQACAALAARGFTLGTHVYLALGASELETQTGNELLMHELAHVVQHDRGQLATAAPGVTAPGDWIERAAQHLVEATQPRRDELATRQAMPRPPATSSPGVGRDGAAVIARDAAGRLYSQDIALDIEEPGVSVHILVPLTGEQAQQFQADPALASRLAQDFAGVLAPGGRARFENRAFLESPAITSRVQRDIERWLAGGGLAETNGFLDQRAQALGRLNLLAPLERALVARGIEPGSIDWAAVGPTLLAEPPPRPATTLIEASVQDRYHLFLRAIMTEAAARPAVVAATTTAAQLSPILRDYVDHLDRSAFGDGVSIFSEAFLAKWALDVRALRYAPEGFDVERFRPTDSAATLEHERQRVLDDFKRNRMPNLLVAFVRDEWSLSSMTPEGFLAHVDIAALRQRAIAHMVDEFMRLAANDPGYRRALRSATQDQARFDSIRTLVTLCTAMQRANEQLVVRLATTPIDQLGPEDYEIGADPFGYYHHASGVAQATTTLLSTLQRGGNLEAAFAALPDIEATTTVTRVTALVALIAHLHAMRVLREQQQTATREDLARDLELRYDDVARIVQTMWDDAERYIHDVYVPKLKEVAIRILTQNRDELARWHDNWHTETPRQIASYRITAMGLEDVARRLRSHEASSIELNGQLLAIDDVEMVEQAAKTVRAIADRLESPEGGDEKRRELREAIGAFDRTRDRINDGTYKPYEWGPEVARVARAELGIGEFPEYATYGMVFTGRVQASQNPFLARAIAGWQFRERREAEFRQVALLAGLGMLTVASLIVPGAAGAILIAADLSINIGVAAYGVVESYRALDLALLDPHLQLQGLTVDQARTAMHHAWVSLAISVLMAAGIAALSAAMIVRGGRGMPGRDMPHLRALYRSDPVRMERLMRAVPEMAQLERLLGLVGDAERLERLLMTTGDLQGLERLIRRVPDPAKLANWMEHAGTLDRMNAVLDRTSGAAQIDALAAQYGDRWIQMESHLAVVGSDARAGARLEALLEHTGGADGFAAMLTPIGTRAEQTAFLHAIERNPQHGAALARAMAPAPGLAGRLARAMGPNMIGHLSVEGGSLRIVNELTIAPETLATLNEADLQALIRACENPAGHGADIARFEGGVYRFRFRTRVNARVDPWVNTMLHEAGFAEGTPPHALFQNMSEADKALLWDLPGNRGRDPAIRVQAARWALGRQTTSVRQFVADFQFYVGEVEQRAAALEQNIEARAQAAIRDGVAHNGGHPLTNRQIEGIYRRITAEPPGPNGTGGLGREYTGLGPGARRAIRERVVREMGQAGPDGRTVGAAQADASARAAAEAMTGDYAIGTTRIAGRIDESTLAAEVRSQATSLHFQDPATAAYHAHVHVLEIPPADRVAGGNEIETYLNTAREGVRSGAPSAVTRRQDGSYSITFSRGQGDVIVNVTPDGIASIATYIPARR